MRPRFDVEGTSISPDHYIGGKRISSAETFETRCPFEWDRVLGHISRGTAETANQAVEAAQNAFPTWAALTPQDRAAYLGRLADVIEAHTEDIAITETMDMGMLLESMRKRLVNRAALNFRNYADLAVEHEERVWSSKGTQNRVIRMPAGPAVIITPWNAPFMLSTWKCAPALAAGNAVILKPAEWSPLSASLLGDMIDEAGIPPGVFNIVQGLGSEVGAALVSDPRVRRISFTGSVPTSRIIGKAAAENIVPCLLYTSPSPRDS